MTIIEMRRRMGLALRLAGLCSHDQVAPQSECVGCRAYDHYMTIRIKYDLRIGDLFISETLQGRRKK